MNCFSLVCLGLLLCLPLFPHDDHEDLAVSRTALVHGTAAPFAVAGYRMGEEALKKLAVGRGSSDLQVTHYAPPVAPWISVIDGLQAATGASLGKGNLHLKVARQDEMRSVVRNRKTGQSIEFRLTPGFVEKHAHLERAKALPAGIRLGTAPVSTIYTSKTISN